jgi:aminoglycoside 6'-N-acetyltransferase
MTSQSSASQYRFRPMSADDLLGAGAPRIVTDPDPQNARAIRAYEKAGFVKDKLVDTFDGIALLMVRNA